MKTFREWQKINESLGYSLGLSTPASVGISSNLASLQELLEAKKKKAMKKKMNVDGEDETGDGEIVPPKSEKDAPEDEIEKDDMGDDDADVKSDDADEDLDSKKSVDDSDDMDDNDKKNLMFMKKKMKKDDKKDDKKDCCDCKKGESCKKCAKMKKESVEDKGFYTIFENNKLVTCSSSKKEIDNLLENFKKNRNEKIELKNQDGEVLWHN